MSYYRKESNKEAWYQDEDCTIFHRENGPAIIFDYNEGNYYHHCYYINGQRHRIDGPACISAPIKIGTKIDDVFKHSHWWYRGQQIFCKNQEEFEQMIRLKAFW